MKSSSRLSAFGLLLSLIGCASIVVDEPNGGSGGSGSVGAKNSGGTPSSDGGGFMGDGSGGRNDPASGGANAMGNTGGRVFGNFGSGGRTMVGSGGSGVVMPDACTPVSCMGNSFPPPKGDVCFEFETSAFGGWQVSNAMGCVIRFDGAPAQAGQMVSAGSHTLEISGCSNNYVSWGCWY